MRLTGMGAAVAAAIVLAASPAAISQARAGGWPTVGEPAPDFTVKTFDGATIALKDLKGQVVVLNFWATWCGPCKQELPLLDAYYRGRKRFGLAVVAVTTEDSVEPARLKPLQDVLGMRLARAFHGGYPPPDAVPMNYVIDRAGVLRYAKAAAFDLDALNAVLIPLLKETPPEAPAPPATTATASAETTPALASRPGE